MSQFCLYKISFDPPIEKITIYPHLQNKSFDGFHLLIRPRIELPRLIISQKKRRVNTTVSFLRHIILDEDTALKLRSFRTFLFDTLLNGSNIPLGLDYYVLPSFKSNENETIDVDLSCSLIRPFSAKDFLYSFYNGSWKEEDAQKNIVGRVGITTYNSKLFIIKKISFDLNPCFKFYHKSQDVSYYDYYLESRKIRLEDSTQPLFLNGNPYKLQFHSSSISNNETKTAASRKRLKETHYIPELSMLTGITFEIFRYAQFLPLILSNVNTHMKIMKFQEESGLTFRNIRLLRQVFTHPSYSNEHEGFIANYQRLEFLGDSVLEWLVTAKLFNIFPNSDPKELSIYKACLVNNSFLGLVASTLNIQQYLILTDAQMKFPSDSPFFAKVVPDVFEALIGALYIEKGLRFCAEYLESIFFPKSNVFRECYTNLSSKLSASQEPDIGLLQIFAELEDSLKVNFQDKKILIEAFTHGSLYIFSESDPEAPRDPSEVTYQRLEFLGDCLLLLCTSCYLYFNYPTASEGQMSMCRAKIVDNETLARCAKSLGLSEYLIHRSSHFTFEGPRLQKARADLFESLLAAIFMDNQGMEACYTFVVEHLIKQSDVNPENVVLDPKSLFQHLIQCEGRDQPCYKIISVTKTLYVSIYLVGIYISEELVADAEGETIKESERKAAEKGIHEKIEVDFCSVGPVFE